LDWARPTLLGFGEVELYQWLSKLGLTRGRRCSGKVVGPQWPIANHGRGRRPAKEKKKKKEKKKEINFVFVLLFLQKVFLKIRNKFFLFLISVSENKKINFEQMHFYSFFFRNKRTEIMFRGIKKEHKQTGPKQLNLSNQTSQDHENFTPVMTYLVLAKITPHLS